MIFLVLLTPIFMSLGLGFGLAAIIQFKSTQLDVIVNQDTSQNKNIVTLKAVNTVMLLITDLLPLLFLKNILIYWRKNPTGRLYTYISVINIFITILVLHYA